ncbi:MAG: hypothetical protein ACO29M_07795 [Fluviibacter sp.]
MAKNDDLKDQALAAMGRTMTLGRQFMGELSVADEFMRPLIVAKAINDLRRAIDVDSLAVLRTMENTPLGFRTDRQDGYAEHVLRDCMIQAMLDGLSFAGNQWNIIAGNYYVTREGWTQKLMRIGATGIAPFASLPSPSDIIEGPVNEKGVRQFTIKMGAYAECWLAGEKFTSHMRAADGYDTRRIFSAHGKDLASVIGQVSGKAEATALKKLYYLCRGIPEPAEADEVVSVIESEKVITIAPVNGPTEEQQMLYDKAREGLENANSQKELQEAWGAVNSLKKSGSLTGDQVYQLTALKDLRKSAIQ